MLKIRPPILLAQNGRTNLLSIPFSRVFLRSAPHFPPMESAERTSPSFCGMRKK